MGGEKLKISIEEVSQTQEEEIIIKCHEVNNDILNLIQSIKIQGGMLIGNKENVT